MALAGCQQRKAEGFPGYAFVANRAGSAVAAVDLGAFAVARHIPLDGEPSQVVSNAAAPAVYALTPENGTVHEIVPESLNLGRKVSCARTADRMHLSPDGKVIWVLSAGDRILIGLSTGEMRELTRIPLPAVAGDFDLRADGFEAAAGFPDDRKIGLIDLGGAPMVRLVDAGASVGKLRYRSDGRMLLCGNREEKTLSMFETSEGRLVVRLPLAVSPEHFCFDQTGGQLFLTGAGMDAVVAVHPYQTQVAFTILAGSSPGFMASSSEPEYLFVANPGSGDVTVVDIATQRVTAVVAVGRGPGYITLTPDNQYALVLNTESGDMAVIRIESLTGRRRKFAPLFMMAPVGSEPVCAVVRAV